MASSTGVELESFVYEVPAALQLSMMSANPPAN